MPAPPRLGRTVFDAAALWTAFPPQPSHRAKKTVLALATDGRTPSGPLTVTRYAAEELPEDIPSGVPRLDTVPDIFTYPPVALPAVHWHLNFADPYLFFAYRSMAFAQEAARYLRERAGITRLPELLGDLEAHGFQWGTSDGN